MEVLLPAWIECMPDTHQRQACGHLGLNSNTFPLLSPAAPVQVIGRPVVDNCLAGYNSTVFAYGQTGSGKVSERRRKRGAGRERRGQALVCARVRPSS